jgi:hypothetical protein
MIIAMPQLHSNRRAQRGNALVEYVP